MITRKNFFRAKIVKKKVSVERNVVENFLKLHYKNGFTAKEIVKRVKRSSGVVFSHLRKLIKQKKVLRKSPNFIWK